MKKFGFPVLLILMTALSTVGYGAEQSIHLEYKPNAKLKRSPASVAGSKIYFEDFRDQRAQPRQLGENLEDKEKRVLVVTSDPQGAGHLVRSALDKEFRNKGFSVVGGPGSAEKIIGGTLIKFWTVETNRYNSQTQIKVEVKDKSGGIHYSKMVSGTGKNFGRSLSETNYNESISDSLVMIIEELFTDQEFLRALSEKGAASRPGDRKLPPEISPPPSAPMSPPPSVTSENDYIFHRVYAGETMATIAKWYSGNANNWKILASHNLEKEPFKMKADDVVKVPRSLATANPAQPGFSTASGRTATGKDKKVSPAPPASTPPPVTGPAFGPK